jgi:predicted phosphodiesterase
MPKIAILADIHGNLAAFEAVIADLEMVKPDEVIVAGDFQNRGPQPKEVTDLIIQKQWRTLRGNHEDYVIQQARDGASADPLDYYNWLPARWTAKQVKENIDWLQTLPISMTLEGPDGSNVVIAHGSARSNAEGIFPTTSDDHAQELIGRPAPSLFCCAHTHVPLERTVSSTQVFNVGSVGFPFDGDHRAAYGVIEWYQGKWRTQLRRVVYPWSKTSMFFDLFNLYHEAGPLVRLIQRELESARPHLTPFWWLYESSIRAGELDIFKAIDHYVKLPPQIIENRFNALKRENSARLDILQNAHSSPSK